MQKADDVERNNRFGGWLECAYGLVYPRCGAQNDDPAGEQRRFSGAACAPEALIIPNLWDAGTAKLLAAMGFEALVTTSLGVANTLAEPL